MRPSLRLVCPEAIAPARMVTHGDVKMAQIAPLKHAIFTLGVIVLEYTKCIFGLNRGN
jgi:hypothetical protein